ncbi:hypothetical protein DFH09DRAFT_1319777 [Mycena vulgaris]|nr:hypothetical protein DFH09DRAFT_1319777 [Mycena vulgaris]
MLSTPPSRPSPKRPALSGSASFNSSSTVFSNVSYRHRHLRAPRDGPGSRRPPSSPITRAIHFLHPRLPVVLIHHSHPSIHFSFRPFILQPSALSFTAQRSLIVPLTIDTSALSPSPLTLPHVIHPHCIAFPISFLRAPHTPSPPSCVLSRHRSPRVHLLSMHTYTPRIHAPVPPRLAASPSPPLRILIILVRSPSHPAASLPPTPLHHPSASVSLASLSFLALALSSSSYRTRPFSSLHPSALSALSPPQSVSVSVSVSVSMSMSAIAIAIAIAAHHASRPLPPHQASAPTPARVPRLPPALHPSNPARSQ